jgi:hypothetical protein
MWTNFSTISPISNFMKVCPAVLELSHLERPTDGHGAANLFIFCKILLRLFRRTEKSGHRVLGEPCGRTLISFVKGGRHASHRTATSSVTHTLLATSSSVSCSKIISFQHWSSGLDTDVWTDSSVLVKLCCNNPVFYMTLLPSLLPLGWLSCHLDDFYDLVVPTNNYYSAGFSFGFPHWSSLRNKMRCL